MRAAVIVRASRYAGGGQVTRGRFGRQLSGDQGSIVARQWLKRRTLLQPAWRRQRVMGCGHVGKGIRQAPLRAVGDAAEGAPSVISLRVSSGRTGQPRLSPWAGAQCSNFQSVGQRSGPGCLRVSGAVAPSAASALALSRSLLRSIHLCLWPNCVVHR
jgi:hypothetical protein